MKNLIYSAVMLLAIGAVTTATSTQNGGTTSTTKVYAVASDCSNATMTTGSITVIENNISLPLNTTFLSIGLPLAKVYIGAAATISDTIAPALVRSCNYTTALVSGTTNSIYTCYDNSIYQCVVTLTPLSL